MTGPRVIAVVQARMTSARLPGKVLHAVAGRPLVAWQLARLARAQRLDGIVLATTTNAEDDPLAALGQELGVAVFRGDEHDVLARMLAAAESQGAEVVVRITADCPAIDGAEVDRVVARLVDGGFDYVSNAMVRRLPRGLDAEAMTMAALRSAGAAAPAGPAREHVTPFIRLQPWRFVVGAIINDDDHSQQRWTVDTAEDLAFISALIADCGEDFITLPWRDLVARVNAHPQWTETLTTVRQKAPPPPPPLGQSYACLSQQELRHHGRMLRSLQPELAETLRHWRNAQLDILRQRAPLSADDQQCYFHEVVIPQYRQAQPAQVLFSYWWEELLIGYGGLVHIDWHDRRAEVSILLTPERSACPATHAADVRAFLPLISAVGFRLLGLQRLESEAWDLRPHHLAAIEAFGFVREGVRRQHLLHQGRRIDAILHGLLPAEAAELAAVDQVVEASP